MPGLLCRPADPSVEGSGGGAVASNGGGEVVAEGGGVVEGALGPSDFPLANLDQRKLGKLLAKSQQV